MLVFTAVDGTSISAVNLCPESESQGEHSCASPNWGSRADPQIGGEINTKTERGSNCSSLSYVVWVSR